VLFYQSAPDTGLDMWTIPATPEGRLAPGGAPKSYLVTKANESFGRFSPDSPPRWVAYQSDDTGRSEILRALLPGAARRDPDFDQRRAISGMESG